MGLHRGPALGEEVVEEEGLQHRDPHLSQWLILALHSHTTEIIELRGAAAPGSPSQPAVHACPAQAHNKDYRVKRGCRTGMPISASGSYLPCKRTTEIIEF